MGLTLTCGRCGQKWTVMAGSPFYYEGGTFRDVGGLIGFGGDSGHEVCDDCAHADGNFCTCMFHRDMCRKDSKWCLKWHEEHPRKGPS